MAPDDDSRSRHEGQESLSLVRNQTTSRKQYDSVYSPPIHPLAEKSFEPPSVQNNDPSIPGRSLNLPTTDFEKYSRVSPRENQISQESQSKRAPQSSPQHEPQITLTRTSVKEIVKKVLVDGQLNARDLQEHSAEMAVFRIFMDEFCQESHTREEMEDEKAGMKKNLGQWRIACGRA